jgi:hypothetical protein
LSGYATAALHSLVIGPTSKGASSDTDTAGATDDAIEVVYASFCELLALFHCAHEEVSLNDRGGADAPGTGMHCPREFSRSTAGQ